MKLQILNTEGKKIKEITTSLFEEPVREDLIRKVVEAERIWQPYASKDRAGLDRSASGNTKKRRHVWKSDRGRGLARLPRKIFWRRGTQFSWEAAIVPSTKGGRRAHPPKGSVNLKKINKKEMKKALLSSLTYVSSSKNLKEKYSSLKDQDLKTGLPIIIDKEFLELKTKDFLIALKNVLGNLYDVAIQKRSARAGIGKLRGRKNKKNAGLLLVTGPEEKIKMKGFDVAKSDELVVSDLASNGARLTLFTEESIKELEKFKESKK
jgi:large subunit ribosomal protein L4e